MRERRALQTYRVAIGDEVIYRRPVLPDIVDKNDKMLIVGGHLAERWPRGIGFCDSTYSRPIG